VRVRDGGSRAAIAGARVRILRSGGAGLADLYCAGDVILDGPTDERGLHRVSRAVLLEAAAVLVSARGYRARLIDGPVGRQAAGPVLEVDLTPGLRIEGRVRDSDGNPLTGVQVACMHCEYPCGGVALEVLALPGRDRADATSDADGAFVLDGLSEGGYTVFARAEGWTLDQSIPGSALRAPRGVDGVYARAGATSLDIVMVPVRIYDIRVVRGESMVPVTSSLMTVDVSVEGRVLPTAWRSYGRSDRAIPAGILDETIAAASREQPGRAVGHVLLDPAHLVEHGVAYVEADGYRPRQATVRLRLPDALSGTPTPDVIALEPVDAGPVGTVTVRLPRRPRRLWRPPLGILSGCRPEDGHRFHLRATRAERGRWTFLGVPAGDVTIRVFDGLSFSSPTEVTVPTEGVVACSPPFAPPEGVVLVLRDEDGRRLFDAELTMVFPPGDGRGVANLRDLTRLRVGPYGVLDVIHPLAPGTYAYAVGKVGFEQASGTLVVRPRRVTRQVVMLSRREP
jgi:hypothetical protein